MVLQALRDAGGYLPFHYKSSPEAIEATFSMSRKAFKSALTKLLEEEKITLDESGMRLKA